MRPGTYLFAATVLVLAACSSVPDVVFEDDGGAEGGAASSSGGPPADAAIPPDAARTPVTSSDRGCIRKSGGETCCGSSICDDKKNCEGPAKVEQCTTCAYECANRRCCVKDGATSCVDFLALCPR